MKKTFMWLIVTWIVLFVTACTSVRGSGHVIVEEREVPDFTQVVINGQGQLLVSQGEEVSLRIEAEDNIVPLIETRVSDDTLFIKSEAVATAVPTVPIKIHLTMKEITSLESNGLGKINAANIEVDQLQINGSGFGKIVIDDIVANRVSIQLQDDSNAELNGEAVNQEIDVSGHADYRAANLASETVTVNIGDTGTATIWVEKSLSGVVNGNGDVLYYGMPETDLQVSDSGKAKNREK